jgi:hypothetical protein
MLLIFTLYRSFFDLLSELFIIKSSMKLVSSLMSPFMDCETKEKAKQELDKLRRRNIISQDTYKAIFKKGMLNNIPRRYRSYLVPEDEAELRKMTKVQRAIERLNHDIDTKAVRQRGAVTFEDDECSDGSGIAPATVPRRQDRFIGRSMSMNPKRAVRHDERSENIKKRMQIEHLERDESSSDSDLFEDQATLDLIKNNYSKTDFGEASQRRRSTERDLVEESLTPSFRREKSGESHRPAVMTSEEV